MQITFLSADVPLTKTYTKVQGALVKSPYPHVTYFTSHTENVDTIQAFAAAVRQHAAQGHCLLKGNVQRPLTHESRAGSTDRDAETLWACLDIDGIQHYQTPQEIMALLGLGDLDYLIQYSASHGVEEHRGLSCHIFFLLAAPIRAPILKSWLMHLNLNTSVTLTTESFPLREQIRLTRAGAALRWPIDITVCQNDKLLFIAPPTLNNVPCTLKDKDRIQLVTGTLRALPSARLAMNQLSQTKLLADEHRDALRTAHNFPKLRKNSTRWEKGIEIQHNPGHALVTGTKQERGFIYLNLNGGDSWGYYHPETDASLIFNFKGEPTYKTEQLLPEYWASWCEKLATETDPLNTGIEHFAVCDDDSGAYYVGHYKYEEDALHITQARNESQTKSYLKEHNLPVGEFIPRWTVGFDPHSTQRLDKINRTINTYNPSPLMQALYKRKKPKTPPSLSRAPTIHKVILSTLGSDEALLEPFLNWLACIVQHRTKIGVAWVLHGVPGTGKGLLVNHIMRPILGNDHVGSQLMSRFGGRFNALLEDKLLMLIDEARIGAARNQHEMSETIKHLITEDPIEIERKFANATTTASYVNFIFASNQPDPVHIELSDRRFNIATYQTRRIPLTDEEVTTAIPAELEHFAQYLWCREAHLSQAREIIPTAARQDIMNLSRDSGTMLADALLTGDIEVFVDALRDIPPGFDHSPSHLAYETWLFGTLRDITQGTYECRLTRDDLGMLYQYCIGDTVPLTPTKLTQYLHHKGLKLMNYRIRNTVQRGIITTWAPSAETLERITELVNTPKTPAMRRVK